jgi:hypothetical protein
VDTPWKDIVGQQLGAAIDMLENALLAFPEEVWSDRSQPPEPWYLAFHTLFFLDYYLSDSSEAFAPPAPFTLDELDPAGVLPERPYTQAELHAYLQHGRAKCRATLAALAEERARRRYRYGWGEASGAELLLYSLRHVQHHTAQLNLLLRQRAGAAPGWVARGAS